MKRAVFILIAAFLYRPGNSQETVAELVQIVKGIDGYKNKAVVMTLKLKNHDTIFEHIVFYDRKNHDIEFDISADDVKRALKGPMNNLHEGLDYTVFFTVKDVNALGLVIADITGFEPVLLQKLPEKRSP